MITSAALQEYANDLKMNGLSKSHIVGILSVLGAAMDYAVEPLHYLTANPMRYVKYPKVERKPRERIILTLEEWQQIIDRFPAGSRFHIPLMIGFYTGLRISEAFALTWNDIDLEKRTITVSKQIVKRNFGADVRKVVEQKGKREMRSSWYFTTTKTPASEKGTGRKGQRHIQDRSRSKVCTSILSPCPYGLHCRKWGIYFY